jgi:hypothetical protein
MHKRNSHGSFAHCGGTALNRVVAHVASREQSRDIRFQMMRLSSAWNSAKCFIQGDDRDINVSLALGDRVLRLQLCALGI